MAFFAEKPAKKLDKSSLVEPVVTGTNIKQVGTHFLSRGSSPAFLDAYWVVGAGRACSASSPLPLQFTYWPLK